MQIEWFVSRMNGLGHIRKHPEMVGQERRIREVLQEPDVVFTSHKDSSATMRAARLGQSIQW